MTVMCVRIEQEDLLATAAVPALLRARHIEQLPRHFLLRREYHPALGEDAEDGSCVRDGLHRVFDCGFMSSLALFSGTDARSSL